MPIARRVDFIDQSNPRGAELCNVTIAFTVLSIVVVGLRVAIRAQRKIVGYDDAWICLALVLGSACPRAIGRIANKLPALLDPAHDHRRDQRSIRLWHEAGQDHE